MNPVWVRFSRDLRRNNVKEQGAGGLTMILNVEEK